MLEKKMAELAEEINELESHYTKYMLNTIGFEEILNADQEALVLMRKAYKVADKCVECMLEQSKAIDQIHRKLDKLIAITSKSKES